MSVLQQSKRPIVRAIKRTLRTREPLPLIPAPDDVFDASDLTVLSQTISPGTDVADGSPVGYWNGAVTFANDTTRPTWHEDGPSNNAFLRFDGINDHLDKATGYAATAISSFHVVRIQTFGFADAIFGIGATLSSASCRHDVHHSD